MLDYIIGQIGVSGSARCTVCGNSMEPIIPNGCCINVSSVTGQPQIGDIVVFLNSDQKLIVHRVIGSRSGGLILKGDSNTVVDEQCPIQGDSIIGIVDAVETDRGWINLRGLGFRVASRWLAYFSSLHARFRWTAFLLRVGCRALMLLYLVSGLVRGGKSSDACR